MASKSDIAIHVEGLSKSYTISHNTKHDTLAELIVHSLRKGSSGSATKETFWALNDVSFDIKEGDSVGIIGRNGAGKSTLLKVLSRVTEPTRGSAILHGRVGSLLEVGTGFHPDLTGRENVYLNGTILGMTRAEITRQFDAIVDFSGTERFLDTPVKRYSSGMYVRLAFAIAAHMNPEILIVDEVLAVGDAEFQKKCLGKMQDASTSGRTVLFVSHAIHSVLQLCNRCIYMKNGKLMADGPASEVAGMYIHDGKQDAAERNWALEEAPGDETARLLGARVLNFEGDVDGDLKLTDTITLEMNFQVLKAGYEIAPVFHVFNQEGICMFSKGNAENEAWLGRKYEVGSYRASVTIPASLFNDGGYNVTPILVRNLSDVIVKEDEAIHFELHDDGAGRAGFTGKMMGVLRPAFPWDIEQLSGVVS